MVLQTRWAVLLCKFKDNQSEPPVPNFRTICEKFFIAPSAGYNAYQFFSDMSHRNIDLSGSEVLGWFTLDANVSDALPPVDPPPPDWIPKKTQGDMMALAKQAAINAGVDMNRFFGTVLIMNLTTGWAQGSSGAVFADWRRVDGRNPNGTLGPRGTGGGNGTEIFGQEMGHGYGLNHSYREGSNAEYQDPWDIMSTFNAFSAVDQDYCARGPGLNAWNMRDRGWLDESRVWKTPSRDVSFNGTVHLRPLHRHDLPGHLAAEITAVDGASSNYLLEFRIKRGWDEAIPRSAVLVHQFKDGHSVIMRGTSGQYDLANGGTFERPPYINVQVASIDEASQTATVRIAYRSPPPKGWISLGGQWSSIPIVAKNADGRLEIFIVGQNGQLYHRHQTSPSNGWNERWESLGGEWNGYNYPSVVNNADGRLEIFITGQNEQLYHRFQISPSNGWN